MAASENRKKWETLITIVFSGILITGVVIGWPYLKNIQNDLTGQETTITQEDVTVETDLEVYTLDDEVKIKVTNNLDIPIYYAKRVECGASFWELENCFKIPLQYYRSCLWDSDQYNFTKLRPGESIRDTWTFNIRKDYDLVKTKPGCFRIVFPFSLKDKTAAKEGWEKDRVEVYSPKFNIE
ncbi:hypothetical protein ACFLZ1_02220 [Patescibacteria group bacterium]